jgi:Kef-type K+ transport system membrane component KefB
MAASSAQTLAEAAAGFGVVLLVSVLLIPLLRGLRQPRVMAEILAGVILGPSLLGLLPADPSARMFPPAVQSDLAAVAEVGILLFMFLIGWEMDPSKAGSRRTAVLGVSLASTALPLGTGVALAALLYHDHATVAGHHVGETGFVLFVGTAMAITAFPVLARIIAEHRLQLTPVGSLALAAAAVGDVLAWCLLAVVSVIAASAGPGRLAELAGWCALYVLTLIFVARPLLRRLIARMTPDGVASPILLTVLAAGIFLAGFATQRIGLDAIFGAFSFGLIMPAGSREALAAAVRLPLEHITTLLLPVFFISTGLSVDLGRLGGSGLAQLAAIIAVACFGKLAGAFGAARLSGMSTRDATSVGLLMNTRGLTELIILNVGVSMGVLDGRMFTMMVVMALVTTGMAGPLLPRRADPLAEGAPAAADLLVEAGSPKR